MKTDISDDEEVQHAAFIVVKALVEFGPETLHRFMRNFCWFSFKTNVPVANTLLSMGILYKKFSLQSEEERLGKSFDTSLAFSTGHV